MTKYDVTNDTKANRVLNDAHGKSLMIEAGTTRDGVDLDDATAARLRAAKNEVTIKQSQQQSDASQSDASSALKQNDNLARIRQVSLREDSTGKVLDQTMRQTKK
jgi:hypothetical protein